MYGTCESRPILFDLWKAIKNKQEQASKKNRLGYTSHLIVARHPTTPNKIIAYSMIRLARLPWLPLPERRATKPIDSGLAE